MTSRCDQAVKSLTLGRRTQITRRLLLAMCGAERRSLAGRHRWATLGPRLHALPGRCQAELEGTAAAGDDHRVQWRTS